MESEDDWNMDNIMDGLNLSQPDIIQRDRVFLKNLPTELMDDGIRHICEVYGKIRDIHRPNEQNYAFVTFATPAEAQNCLRLIRGDTPYLKIIAEYARIRPPRLPSNDLDFIHDRPVLDDSKEPIRNVLELSKREIQGPFGEPTEMHTADSLISLQDYKPPRGILLKCADPTKEFLWNSSDEISFNCEFKEYQKQIVHGRAIFLKLNANDNDPETTDESSKKTFSFNSNLISNIPRCANCSRPADKNCKNCQKPQCSLECHASACKNAKENGEQVQVKPPSKIEAHQIKNTVKITAVLNHRLVFLRPATVADDIAFARLNCDTVRCAKDASTLTCLPQVGLLVLAKFDFYQRALVLKHLSDTTVAVAFIDYGNVEIRDFHELKIMPDKLKTVERFASKFELNNIEHDIMNFAALKVLYRYMANETELRMEMNENNRCVNLKASDKWINELVNQRNVLKIERQVVSNFTKRVFFGEVPYKPIEKIKEMCGKEVIILDNSQIAMNDLAFIDVDDLKLFRENDRRIQNICNYLFQKDELCTPLRTEICVVKYRNGRWYRVECVEVINDGFATMQFIDFGNMKPIEITDIRRIPQALLFECVTVTADCFSKLSIDTTDQEKCNELKEQYEIHSHHKIKEINVEIRTDELNGQSAFNFALLEKM